MDIYHYHPYTGEFIGIGQADESPLEPVFLIPAYATNTIPPDCDENQKVIWDGKKWTIESIPLPPEPVPKSAPTVEELLSDIRNKRNRLLYESDWTQLPDTPLTAEKKSAWQSYRRELREFPAVCDPHNPAWPLSPT